MGGIFSGPSVPETPPPPATPPTRDDTEARSKASDARKQAANAKGRTSTLLTAGAGAGVDTDDTLIKRKTLLGGGSSVVN